jgi:DNA-binding LacI/PurR family transcriptional regulator
VVLNGAKSGTKVSEKTRDAILRAAKELNYRPNAVARSLRKRRTGIVGFFSGYDYIEPRNQYIAEVMSGLQNGCVRHDLNLLLFTPSSKHAVEDIVANLADGRLDGLVITARPEHRINELLAGSHLPVVAIADRIPELPSVMADAAQGGRLQARHLAERGHRRVLFVPSDYPFPSVIERETSFLAEAESLQITVLHADPVSGHLDDRIVSPGIRLNLSDKDLSRLTGPDRVTAVQCWDDTPAYRIASQIAEHGLRIPDDIAIAGYNGCAPSVEPRWKLSTVCACWSAVGSAAIDVLSDSIEGGEVPMETILPVHFVVGSTT